MLTQEKTIGDFVAENFRTAEVFKKYHIDFCCKGGRTVEEACDNKKVSPEPKTSILIPGHSIYWQIM